MFLTLAVALPLFAFANLPIKSDMASSQTTAVGPWWNENWHFRIPVTVSAAGYNRSNKLAEAEINFTSLINSLGQSGPLNVDSIRMIEETAAGDILNDAVPYQFDPASDFNANSNARGTVTFLMTGQTAASATRYYVIYFDTSGSFTPLPVTPRVTLTDNIDDEGFSSYRIQTESGTYYYQKLGGGFSSLVDANTVDWIGWNAANGSRGDLRGIPNLVHEDDGGYFHPGRVSVNSTILNQGPLKATFQSTSNDGLWQAVWEIFPTYARMTLLKANSNYWFQYEGTPGGTLQGDIDFVVRSYGTQTLANISWTGDLGNLEGDEWAFVADPNLGRSIFLAHHTEDLIVDSYKPSRDGRMTILGFGRNDNSRFLRQVPKQFTIGLVNSTTFDTVAPIIRNAYKPLNVALGTAEQLNGIVTFNYYLPLVFDGEL